MKQWHLFLCLLGLFLIACQNNTANTVSDKEKEEIQQLDSLVNDLAKNKKAKLPDDQPADVEVPSK